MPRTQAKAKISFATFQQLCVAQLPVNLVLSNFKNEDDQPGRINIFRDI